MSEDTEARSGRSLQNEINELKDSVSHLKRQQNLLFIMIVSVLFAVLVQFLRSV